MEKALMSKPREWTDEKLDKAKVLIKFNSARETGEILNMTKNSVLGVLHRDKVKNGYVPKRGVKRTSTYYRGKKTGERPCNICRKMFDMHGKYDRFCNTCRRNLPYA